VSGRWSCYPARSGSDQPIWLTTGAENANGAGFLFLVDGAVHAGVAGFKRVFELFDGRDDAAVAAARDRWKAYKDAGHMLSYWQQDDRGRWNKAG
jgi:DNA polymerase-3 subunit chi